MLTEDALIRRAGFCGFVATSPWIVAAAGWAAHWNAYTNLGFTLGGFVLWGTFIACTLDRYRVRPK